MPEDNIVNPTSILCRAPDLRLELQGENRVWLQGNHAGRLCPNSVLEVLAAFAHPCTLASATVVLAERCQSKLQWMEMSALLLELVGAGFLMAPESQQLRLEPTGFGHPGIHVAMLNDEARTRAFLRAIAETVKPGDVVVDLGTGTGVLAMAAVRHGARRVYALEVSTIGSAAERLFAANAMSDKIQLIRGWSSQITLPERADVVVAELVGNDPLDERILDLLADARERFLKPQGRLIPAALRVYGTAVAVPGSELDRAFFTPGNLARWTSTYGADFSTLADATNFSQRVMMVSPQSAQPWLVSAKELLFSCELGVARTRPAHANATTVVAKPALLGGVLESFELQLTATSALVVDPANAGSDCHWKLRLCAAAQPTAIAAGQVIRLDYSGEPPWLSLAVL